MKKNTEINGKNFERSRDERGVSLVITLIVMTMLLGFVALALSRTASEARVAANDTAESRALAASEAGLEDTTRDFATILENKLTVTDEDIKNIKKNPVDGFEQTFDIVKSSLALSDPKNPTLVILQGGDFEGLYSLRDEWQINVSAREKSSDVEVETMRRFYNNRIPLFQFGAFYQDDLELNRPPLFTFSGKVHTNSNLFVSSSPLSSSGGIFFKSKVTVAGEIVNDIWKTGTTFLAGKDDTYDVYFPNASGVNQKLAAASGSVTCNSNTGNTVLQDTMGLGRVPLFPYPNCTKNTGWANFAKRFEGNLVANAPQLRLPIDRLTNADGSKIPLIEMMRRGKNVGDKANLTGVPATAVATANQDNGTLSKERYANKQGIRISLSDSKDKLPGCAATTGNCGVRLDAPLDSSIDNTLGYKPKGMIGTGSNYKTTWVNGSRLAVSGRQVWIKVETVDFDYDREVPITADITEDFLSLGMTEPADYGVLNPYDYNQDTRSIVKIQRFYTSGPEFTNAASGYLTNRTVNGIKYNFIARYKNKSGKSISSVSQCLTSTGTNAVCDPSDVLATPVGSGSAVTTTENQHYKLLYVPATSESFLSVPFPIQMYDSREGNRRESDSAGIGNVFRNGVMSMIDIDVANLRRFFNKEFDGQFPNGLKSTDVPNNRGWVVYFSDRRGDYNFDGRYNMEDVNPDSSSLIEEDLNNNGAIEMDTTNEAPSASDTVNSALSAVTDHKYYRRGVRLINAKQVPGKYDSTTPSNTVGFTFASENGVYVKGNYNVDYVAVASGTNVTNSSDYYPQPTDSMDIPSSVVGDSVTILSSAWTDSNSFVNAFKNDARPAVSTQVRFAAIIGDSLTARSPGIDGRFDGLNGGLHNLVRFLEDWRGDRLNYSGSLINLYNSFNNNGKWKCCETYDPPTRDWTFDSTFNDPYRLPPGSPFAYYMSLTGFQRVNQ